MSSKKKTPEEFSTLEIPGRDAIACLNEHRARYSETGQYPFLIGDAEELERLRENGEIIEKDTAAILRASRRESVAKWLAERRGEEDEETLEETFGDWPNKRISDQGSISLHKDVLSGKVLPKVYLGLAKIAEPWHLPAVLKFGAWNECPEPEVHCAFYRYWQEKYGAEIAGISGDVVECVVRNPPTNRQAATTLAWEQYFYCMDIVEQGCGSVAVLAATLLNSKYWYFWWD